MSSKARFSSQQLPVKVVEHGEKAYIFICANEEVGVESYPETEEWNPGRSSISYYEYDYNEIVMDKEDPEIEFIMANPEQYIDCVPKDETETPGEKALREVEELRKAIERGLAI